MIRVLFLILIWFVDVSVQAGPANDSAPKGGNFTFGMESEPTTLHPINYTDYYSAQVFEYIFDSLLVRHLDTYELLPGLASSFDISKDGKVFTFTLREGAEWSDGKPITTEDVKFSYDSIFDDKFKAAPRRAYFENIEKVEIVDAKTVKFHAKKKYFQNFDVCAEMAIVPKHIYSDHSNKKLNREPVGSGPYKYSSYDKGKKLVLEKNDKWWGYKEPVLEYLKGRYNFAKISFKFITDETLRTENLKKGEIDYFEARTEQFNKKMVGPEWGKKVFKVKAENKFPKSYGFIGWNLRNDLFKDKKVRVALAHLFNRELVIQKFLSGMSVPGTGPWHYQNDYTSPRVKPFLFDPKQALTLLKEAGWEDSDKNGVLDKMINGKKVDFKFTLVNPNPDVNKYFTIFKEDAKKVGVDIEIKNTEWNSFLKLLDERKFEALALSWSGSVDPDPKQIFHSASDVMGGSNFVGYRNPEVDRLIDQAREELDKKKRIPLLQTVYEKIAEDAPYLFMFNAKYEYYGHTAKIEKARDTMTYHIGTTYWWTPSK